MNYTFFRTLNYTFFTTYRGCLTWRWHNIDTIGRSLAPLHTYQVPFVHNNVENSICSINVFQIFRTSLWALTYQRLEPLCCVFWGKASILELFLIMQSLQLYPLNCIGLRNPFETISVPFETSKSRRSQSNIIQTGERERENNYKPI